MIKIYISYHDKRRVIQSEILTPIHAGKAISKIELPIRGDNEGDNISEKNPSYCEMTAIYWAWKNDLQSDYIGFFHYRRFFDFYPRRNRSNVIQPYILEEEGIFDDFCEEYGLNDEKLNQFIPQYDAIISEPYKCDGVSIREHYAHCSPYHYIKDFDLLGDIFKKYYPTDFPFFKKMAQSHDFYTCNLFIFKRNIFEQYCEWIFPILYHLEQQLDVSNYNNQGRRAIAFLSERLTTMFIIKNLLHQLSLKIKYLRQILIHKTPPIPDTPTLPNTSLPIVTVVTAADKNYFPHTAAMLASVLKNANQKVFIDIIILIVDLEEEDRNYLLFLEKLHPSCKIHFFNMFYQCRSVKKNEHLHNFNNSYSSYFRIIMPYLLTNHDKIIYLDADTIVLHDIAQLFSIDVDDYFIAACQCLGNLYLCESDTKSTLQTGQLIAKKYCTEYLKINDYNNYFNAGVMLLNLRKMRTEIGKEEMTYCMENGDFWFADQCILNKFLFQKLKLISLEWNIFSNYSNLLPNRVYYDQCYSNPKIIHFAGWQKPWITDTPFASYYWFYLKETPYYETVFHQRFTTIKDVNASVYKYYNIKNFIRNKLFRCWSKLPKFLQKMIFPIAQFVNQQLQ